MLGFLLKAPLLPLKGVISLAQVIEGEVRRQAADPSRLRRKLEEIEEALETGDITAEEARAYQQQALTDYQRAQGQG